MTDGDTLHVTGNILLLVAMVGAVAMPIVYALLAPWMRSATGRVLMALMIALPLILGSNILGIAYPGDVRQWLRLGVYAAVTLAVWGIVAALVRIQTRQVPNHDNGRAKAADAWDQGHEAGRAAEHEWRTGRQMTNPYRDDDGPEVPPPRRGTRKYPSLRKKTR